MTPKSEYRTTEIPNQPGVYVLRDRFREVIYVGKAKSLRRRMSSYFQPSRSRTSDIRIRSLINSICFYEIFPVRTEEEALMRESAYIKQYKPRYNVVLRDDKRFLLIKIDINAPYPRITLARLRKDDSALYFGPFPLAGVVRHRGPAEGAVLCLEDSPHVLDDVARARGLLVLLLAGLRLHLLLQRRHDFVRLAVDHLDQPLHPPVVRLL